VDKGFTTGWEALIIASQSPVTDEPAKGTLNFPSVTLHLETAFGTRYTEKLTMKKDPRVRFTDNLGFPTKMFLNPFNERPSISTISEQTTQMWETTDQIVQQQWSTSTINDTS
jgi:hypothetical protein